MQEQENELKADETQETSSLEPKHENASNESKDEIESKEDPQPIQGEAKQKNDESDDQYEDVEDDEEKKPDEKSDAKVGQTRRNRAARNRRNRKVNQKDPNYIPRKAYFYEHDNRDDDQNEVKEEDKSQKEIQIEEATHPSNESKPKILNKRINGNKNKSTRNKFKIDASKIDNEPWAHDKFDESEQTPKSETEIVKKYGYDIRKEAKLPEEAIDSKANEQTPKSKESKNLKHQASKSSNGAKKADDSSKINGSNDVKAKKDSNQANRRKSQPKSNNGSARREDNEINQRNLSNRPNNGRNYSEHDNRTTKAADSEYRRSNGRRIDGNPGDDVDKQEEEEDDDMRRKFLNLRRRLPPRRRDDESPNDDDYRTPTNSNNSNSNKGVRRYNQRFEEAPKSNRFVKKFDSVENDRYVRSTNDGQKKQQINQQHQQHQQRASDFSKRYSARDQKQFDDYRQNVYNNHQQTPSNNYSQYYYQQQQPNHYTNNNNWSKNSYQVSNNVVPVAPQPMKYVPGKEFVPQYAAPFFYPSGQSNHQPFQVHENKQYQSTQVIIFLFFLFFIYN